MGAAAATAIVSIAAEVGIDAGTAAAIGGALGIDAATVSAIGGAVASGLGTAGFGAAMGAGEAALTGGNIGQGALGGAITGGVTGGLGGPAGDLLGGTGGALGAAAPVVGNALAGAAGGTLGGLATGSKNLGVSALEGGGAGLVSGLAGSLGGGSSGATSGPAVADATPASGVAPVGAAAPGAGGVGAGAGALADPAAITPYNPAAYDVQGAGALPGSQGPSMGTNIDSMTAGLNLGTPGTSASGAATGGAPQAPVGPAALEPMDLSAASQGPMAGAATTPGYNSTIDQLTASLHPTAAGAAPQASFADKAGSWVDNTIFGQDTTPNSTIAQLTGKGLSALPSVAMLGASSLMGQQQPKGYNQLEQQAQNEQNQAQSLINAYQSGTLPAGLQASLTSAAASAKASIQSKYAAMGDSGSSAEAQDLAAEDERMAAKSGQMLTQLLSQGLSEDNSASALYNQLLDTNLKEDQGLSSAMTSFASSLAGGGQTIRIGA